MKIGLIADTHVPGSMKALWPQVFDAFRDVDRILHAGDLWTLGVIDELHSLAPTYVARGNGDLELTDERLQDTWVFEVEGVRIGMVHEFPTPRRRDPEYIHRRRAKVFPDEAPDVVIYGHTHFDEIHRVDDLLCVNPGSPTLPRNQNLRLGTIGFLEIRDGRVEASIHQITELGIEQIAFDALGY